MGCRSATLRGRCRARVSLTGNLQPLGFEKNRGGQERTGTRVQWAIHIMVGRLILRQQESSSGAQIPFPNAASCNFPPWNHEKVATSIIPSSVVLRNYLAHHCRG